MEIGSLTIGPTQPCAVIAEISCNHGQDFQRCIRMLDAAKEAGASAAKIQAYTPQELITLRGDGKAPAPWDYMTMRELYTKAQTPREWFPALFAYAEGINLPLFASVFGKESLEALEAVRCPAYKLASFERDQIELRRLVRMTGKPWMVSRPDYAEANIPTLYCPPNYPQDDFDYALIQRKGFAGFSYHGTSAVPPMLAMSFGAKVLEIHFQLDDEPGEFESEISLTATRFKFVVDSVRATEARKAA